MIYVDFETRSRCDLTTAGAWRYSKHPTTEILIVSWAGDTGEPETWQPDPFRPDYVPEGFRRAVVSGLTWCAHNAFFERSLWQNCLQRHFPGLPCPTRWVDSQAVALQNGLPDSLEGAAGVLFGADGQKDKAGKALMLKMCAPGKKGYHWTPADAARLAEYCQQDVRVTREIVGRLGTGQPLEDAIIALDTRINARGFRIDRPLAAAAYRMAAQLRQAAEAEISRLTSGMITSPGQHARVKKWTGLPSSDRPAIEAALATIPADDPRRPVLQLINDSNRSSVSKYAAALASADPDDDRIRGSLQYHMAFTGRWAGRGFQPQNLPRGSVGMSTDDREAAICAVLRGDVGAVASVGNPLDVLSELIRAVIIPDDGREFIAADFASIEARGVFWLAGEEDACALLRGGGDLYKDMASAIYRVPVSAVTKAQRHIGKSAVLGCGYGMGADRFQQNSGADAATAAAAVTGYRQRFLGVPKLWNTLERLFRLANGEIGPQGVRVTRDADGRRRYIHLPSGRKLTYWDVETKGDRITYMTVHKKAWTRVDAWGGKLCENVVSGIASDLLRVAMLRTDGVGWRIVLTVHDEIVCEQQSGDSADTLAACMSDLDGVPWADGFPLAAEGWTGKRFQK